MIRTRLAKPNQKGGHFPRLESLPIKSMERQQREGPSTPEGCDPAAVAEVISRLVLDSSTIHTL